MKSEALCAPGKPKEQVITHVWSLGHEDPLEKEKGMATLSSVLAWRIPWTEQPAVHGVAKSWTRLSN